MEFSGSANLDSEDEHIPGLHSDLDISDQGNVVLVNSKDVGTLPRRPATVSSPFLFSISNLFTTIPVYIIIRCLNNICVRVCMCVYCVRVYCVYVCVCCVRCEYVM